eukprot:NODE_639_length_5118_cov_0.568440.p1 type:complete len:376 gc:universal NODE_639_length_5118_cov_0.568440:3251-4378(+)
MNISDIPSKLLDIKSQYPNDFNECYAVFNAIFTKYQNQDLIILRCNQSPHNRYIKFIYNHQISILNVNTSQEYYNWPEPVSGWHHYYGPEDPRLFEFNHEIYLYYTMNNPHQQYPVRGLEYIKLKDAINHKNNSHFITPHIFNAPVKEIEKNWLFIHNKTNIVILYSIHPYILGELNNNFLDAKIKREYSCFINMNTEVHFSTNAIEIPQHKVFLFIINIRGGSHRYITHFTLMQNHPPFEIISISQQSIHMHLNDTKFQFINSLTLKNKDSLTADLEDILILSGGLDDKLIFESELSIKSVLQVPMQVCKVPYSEYDYFGYPEERNKLDEINDHELQWIMSCAILLGVLLIIFVIKWRRKHPKYASIDLMEKQV